MQADGSLRQAMQDDEPSGVREPSRDRTWTHLSVGKRQAQCISPVHVKRNDVAEPVMLVHYDDGDPLRHKDAGLKPFTGAGMTVQGWSTAVQGSKASPWTALDKSRDPPSMQSLPRPENFTTFDLRNSNQKLTTWPFFNPRAPFARNLKKVENDF